MTQRFSPASNRGAWQILLSVFVTFHATNLVGNAQEPTANEKLLVEVKGILRSRCNECHSPEASLADFAILDVASLIKANVIKVDKPDASKLMEVLTTEDEDIRMPKDLPALPASEIEKIRRWIVEGAAPFPSDVAVPKENDREEAFASVTGVDYVLKHILAHQRSLPANSQRFLRYFSSNHLLTRGATRDELNLHRDALAKTINHLTYERDPVTVEAIDGETASVFAVDIRKLGWHRDALQCVGDTSSGKKSLTTYDLLLLEYPYGIGYEDSETFGRLTTEFMKPAGLVRQIPYLRIDWFCSLALQPILYHDIMHLPTNVADLEREIIGVDVAAELENHKVARGAVILSGVSRNNRAAERYSSPHGAYWKSIDYATNKGNENIFRDPIHLNGVGGEMIFSLPNGLQGFYLADAAGRRIDAGPIEIVTDKFSEDKVVRNALSCVRCHDRGMKPFKDVVRPSVETLPGNLGFSKREVLELYPPNAELAAFFKSDGERFMTTMERVLGHVQGVEPLIPVTRRFLDEPLTLTTVSGELGLAKPGDLAAVFRSRQFAALGLVPLVSHGAIRRDTWEDYYDQIVRELGLGQPVVPLDAVSRLEYAPIGRGPEVQITTTRGSRAFAAGDEIAILVSNNGKSAVFVELIGTGTKGEKIVLVQAGTKIAAGTQLRFPERATILVKPGLGQEQITLFASETEFNPGIVFRGKNIADRYVHESQTESSSPIIKKTLVIETR